MLALLSALLISTAALAKDGVRFTVAGDDAGLKTDLRAASLVVSEFADTPTNARDIFGAAIADYRRLTETLYAHGYYSGVIHIRLDGREAAGIALLSVPSTITEIAIDVSPGPAFTFGDVAIGPKPDSESELALPKRGDRARSRNIRKAVEATVTAWREAGHAKAAPAAQQVIADHTNATLSARVSVTPGPPVTFGALKISGDSAVRPKRIERIAGLPSGASFSPKTLETVASRMRRTGAFASVSLSEADQLNPDDSMDIGLALVDAKPRRFGFGAEIASFAGLELSGFWLHRNFLGGAERFRFDAAIENIGSQRSGIDYSLRTRLESPALFGADTAAYVLAEYEHLDEPDYKSDGYSFGVGASRIFSDQLQGEIGLTLSRFETDDDLGQRRFTLAAAPVKLSWDRRDNSLNPSSGTYLGAELTPFIGLNGSASGLRSLFDARAYRGFGADNRVVLAGRLQFGSVSGAALTELPPDYLFYSGGGGTVRGQPYKSLNVDLGGGIAVGGRSFVGLSGEIRTMITDKIGAVAFADAGYIGSESLFNDSGHWHSGAGLGLRYQTSLGPIRFDAAKPVSGGTGDGVQLYLGIGQAF